MTKRGGDCYAVAGRAIIDGGDLAGTARLVHATVEHPETPRHGHAWIEYEDPSWGRLVVDRSNGHDVTLPWDFYYALGKVEGAVYYDRETALKHMASTGHFGPWHDDGGDL